MDSKKVVCFDIGGTFVKYGVLDYEGNILAKGSFKSNTDNGQEILDNMCGVIEKYKKIFKIDGISISSPGFIDVENGVITTGTIINGFIGLNMKEYFGNKFGLPVVIDNDANCATIAEHKLGNGKGCKNLVCVTIGTGIGGGIIINNEIYNGSRFMAGEFGFMFINGTKRQNPDHYIYSNYASTRALVEKANKKLNEEVDGKQIFERAESGDTVCEEILEQYFDDLSLGIYNLAYILNPDKILLGGAISQQECLIDKIKERMDRFEYSFSKSVDEYVEIDRFKFLNDAGLIGCLCNFTNKY